MHESFDEDEDPMPARWKPRRLLRRPRETRTRSKRRPRLRFSPTAWAKLLFCETEGRLKSAGSESRPPTTCSTSKTSG